MLFRSDVSEVRRCITGQVADASVTPPSAISDPALPAAVGAGGAGGAATLAATGVDATERDLLIGLALALLTAGAGAIAVRSARGRRTRLRTASVLGHDVITFGESRRGGSTLR